MKKMTNRVSWETFRKTGLLWFINRTLHLFGYAIAVEVNDEDKIIGAYPMKCKFRGFNYKAEEKGFKRVTKYFGRNWEKLLKDCD